MQEQTEAGNTIDIFRGIRCAVLETMFSFCFARELNMLDAPGFHSELEESMHISVPTIPLIKHIHALKYVVKMVPPSLLLKLQPELKSYVDMRAVCI